MTVGVLLVALVLAAAIYIVPGLPGVPRSPAELKFAVIAEVGGPLVCTGWGLPNPAFSPYSEYPRIVSNLPTYLAILRHTKLPPGPLTNDQIITVYRAWLNLEAVQLNWRGAYYDFREFPGPGPSSALVNDTVGKVDLFGRVYDVHEGPEMSACPICLPGAARVATPDGPVPVAQIKEGMRVWSVDGQGRRLAAVVIQTVVRNDAPGSRLVRIVLVDGRELTASPPHRLADGRALGSLRPGDQIDGARVLRVDAVSDSGGRTYDLLPSGETGEYWADGILLQSTLH